MFTSFETGGRLEDVKGAQTIAALHALSDFYTSAWTKPRSHTEKIRQTIASVRARIAQLPREDAARQRGSCCLSISGWRAGKPARKWPERLTQFVRDYDGAEATLLMQVDLLMPDPRPILKQIGEPDKLAKNHPRTDAAVRTVITNSLSELAG